MSRESSIEEMSRLNTSISRLAKVVSQPEKRKALMAGGFIVEYWAKIYVRVDTGRLRSTIAAEPDGNGVVIAPHTDYDAFIEFEIEPYMRPAYDNHRAAIVNAIAGVLGSLIKQAA